MREVWEIDLKCDTDTSKVLLGADNERAMVHIFSAHTQLV
jgi:hypothetical protein